jgi:hypothetical protein
MHYFAFRVQKIRSRRAQNVGVIMAASFAVWQSKTIIRQLGNGKRSCWRWTNCRIDLPSKKWEIPLEVHHDKNTLTDYQKHRETVHRKYDRITGLEALIATHEAQTKPDIDYVRDLKRKLHSAKSQLQNMWP